MSMVFTAKAAYNKVPGTLRLTDTYVQWLEDGSPAPAVNVSNGELACS